MTTAERLASAPDALAPEYDVVIIGSGYGGAITAARLGVANDAAQANLRIAILEQGDEHPTGAFPESQESAIGKVRSTINPLGIFQVDRNADVDVIRASGLGGTSLMNFNVAIVPDREVFLASWPKPFRDAVERDPNGIGELQIYVDRAASMLGANRFVEGEDLPRVDVFSEIAENAGVKAEPLSITVNKEERVTRYGVQRKPCPMHGGDGTGDNSFSKNTLMTNYLPMAHHFGVEMHTRIEVDQVAELSDGRWKVTGVRRSGTRGTTTTPFELRSKRVVLAAGTMGTNAILMRSQKNGLNVSPRLGKNFSGNGDSFGIAYNTDRRTDTQAWSTTEGGPRAQLKCGPSITSVMRFGADQADLRKRFTVEDLSIPRALVDVFRVGLMGLASVKHPDLRPAKVNRWRKDVQWNEDGAMNHSLGFLIMVHDNSDGELVLKDDGTAGIDWPGAPTERMYKDVDEVLKPAVEAIGGTYIKNPWWANTMFGNHLITAHPMGGCTTADNVDGGVVDHAGRVFRKDGTVNEGLYVIDGSVVPRAVGVNPFLTISMFAERAADELRAEMGLPVYDPKREADDR
ncbi:MAG: GMC family oxidoreductase N-terminal domain-containing protein [Nocardiaceae bacterium]|nr:GMC family oxidoreductase N-terminal domain-containing protein [Nocardiaceae bacterium]